MRQFLSTALLLAAAPALAREPMVDNVLFEAGGPPGWSIEIGDDIGLRLGHSFYDGEIVSTVQLYPAARAREWGEVRQWRSRTSGGSLLVVEARPGPCTSPGGTVYAHNVRVVRRSHNPEYRVLTGCGGAVLRRPIN
jgi:hypothetical protein